MKDPEEALRTFFDEECRSRSAAPELPLKLRRPGHPAWKPFGAAAAAALLLSAFSLGLHYRQPSELDRLIADSLPGNESWEQVLIKSSEFVITALEGGDVK